MAYLDRSVSPVVKDFEDYRLLPPEKRESANGILSFYFQNDQLDLLHFTLLVKGGKNYEKTKCVAEMCYNVLKEHRKGETSADFAALVDGFGASFRMNVYMESVYINMIVPKRNAAGFLNIIFNLLLNPTFEKNDIDIYKTKKIKDLQYNQLKVDVRSFQLLFNTFFEKGTPTQTIISEELVNKVSEKQLIDFYNESFCAENITFFAAGNIDDDLKHLINNLLEKIPHNKKIEPVSEISHSKVARNIYERREESVQSAVVLCRRLFDVNPQLERELDVLTTLFGNYFGSRLMQNLREKNGYTYGISCESSRFGKEMLFYINGEVNAENCGKAIEECYNEMRRMRTEPVGEEELQIVRNYMQDRLLRSIDGVTAYMKYYCSCLQKGLDETEFYRSREAIRNISSDRIMELSDELFNIDDFTEIVVGQK